GKSASSPILSGSEVALEVAGDAGEVSGVAVESSGVAATGDGRAPGACAAFAGEGLVLAEVSGDVSPLLTSGVTDLRWVLWRVCSALKSMARRRKYSRRDSR